jgi:hypothetical protein
MLRRGLAALKPPPGSVVMIENVGHFFSFCHPKKAVQAAPVDRPCRKSL